jgi:hypothetical protein
MLLTVLCAARPAWSEDVSFTIGVKAWANEWTSWAPVPGGGGNGVRIIESVSANTRVAPIPQASLRWGNWLVATSYFAQTDYSLGGLVNPGIGELEKLPASRKEFDANFGYYVLPGLAVTVGYKKIDQDFEAARYQWTGPTVGLTAAAPLKGHLAFFGTAAYGRLTMNASTPDDAGRSSFKADYILSELGLAYGVGTPLSHLSLSMTLSYRAQLVSTREFHVSTGFGGYTAVDVHDSTYGPALGILARF